MHLLRPRSNTTPVFRDDVARRAGRVLSGFRTEHWDGRVDGAVVAPTIELHHDGPVVVAPDGALRCAPGEADIIRQVNRKVRG